MQNMNNKKGVKLLATVMVFAMAFAGIVVMADSSDAADVTYINGTINANTYFGEDTTVIVDKDLKIVNGATLSITGNCKFTVNEGVTITVDGAKAVPVTSDKDDEGSEPAEHADDVQTKELLATLSIENTTLVNIKGTISVGEKGALVVENTNMDKPTADKGVYVSGQVNAVKGGHLLLEGGIIVKDGASVNVSSVTNKISKICGYICLNGGATLNLKGEVCNDHGYSLGVIAYELEDTEKKIESSYSGIIIEDYYADSTFSKLSDLKIEAKTTTYNAYTGESGDRSKATINVCDLYLNGIIQGGASADTFEKSNGDAIYLLDGSTESTYYKGSDGSAEYETDSKIVIDDLTVGRTGALFVENANVLVSGKLTTVKALETASSKEAAGAFVVHNFIATDKTAKITVTGEISLDESSLVYNDGNKGITTDDGYLKVVGGTVKITGIAGTPGIFDIAKFDEVFGAFYLIDGTAIICDLDVAIAAADGDKVSDVYIYDGSETAGYVLSKNIEIKDQVNLIVSGKLVISESVVLTVREYGSVTDGDSGTVSVEGKIIDESTRLAVKAEAGIVDCQVVKTIDDGETFVFTTLKIAVADAVSGETIKLVGKADVDGKLTIPAGVTLDVNGNVVNVKNDSELVIDGVVKAVVNNSLKTTEKVDATSSAAEKKAGVVTVNNILLTNDSFDITKFNVAGIYTTAEISDLEGSKVVSIQVFVANATDKDAGAVRGDVSAEDISLVADLCVETDGKLVAKNITLVGSTLEVKGAITSNVVTANGKLSLINITGITVENVVNEEDSINNLSVYGTPVKADSTKDAVLSIVSGTANVVEGKTFVTSGIQTFTVSEGTVLNVYGSVTTSDLTVTGKVDVKTNGNMAISGDLTVLSEGVFNIMTGANATATNVFVGITSDDLGAGATVSGSMNVTNLIYVKSGNTVDDSLINGKGSIKYVVEGADWIVVYGAAGTQVTIDQVAPVKDAVPQGWVKKDGTSAPATITLGSDEIVLTAKIKYDIYSVTVIADNGIGTVAIDGVILLKNSNMFVADNLKAGTHTITFELKNGYEGTVKMTVNGQSVSGYNFTLSGTGADDTKVTINLSGTTPAEPTVPETPSNDGMGITDYLLIVLVIMVVILAVVVIARMFRS